MRRTSSARDARHVPAALHAAYPSLRFVYPLPDSAPPLPAERRMRR
jgi:predicted secreted Zn-dependent protease